MNAAYRLVVIVGGFALLGAMFTDAIAVVGRHTGLPLLGSIELVQVLVGVAGSMALIVATLRDSHAVVRLVLANVSAAIASHMQRANAIGAMVFFLALTTGSAWLLRDMWSAHEETELLLLPILPLRVLIVITLVVTTLVFLRKVLRGGDKC